MDPATLKMALQLAQVLAKSKMVRWVVSTVAAVAVFLGAISLYGSYMLGAGLSASLRAQQSAAACGVAVAGGGAGPGSTASPGAASARIVWPVPGTETGTYAGHDGVDINRGAGNLDMGDPIIAAASGQVVYVGAGRGYGEAIFIKTDIGPTNIYGHTSEIVVRAKQRVAAGQLIGKVGNTGRSTAAHLHFGVKPGLSYGAAMAFLKGAEPFKDPGDATVPAPASAPGAAPVAAIGVSGSVPVLPKSSRWSLGQLRIAATAIAVGKAHGIPEKGWVVAIASGLVESGLRNLDYGDRDSVGWQQQRPSSGWGTVAEIRDPALAAAAFYGVAKHTNNRGLTDIYNWENKPVGVLAQSVQVSAYPAKYAKREKEARAIVALLAGVPASDGGVAGTGAGPTLTVTVGTWNSYYKASARSTIEGARGMAAVADAIGFQEFSPASTRSLVHAALREHYGFTRFENQTQIGYNKDKFKIALDASGRERQGQVRAFRTSPVENVRGARTYNEKFIQWVVLEDRASGARFAVVNTHAPNAIESKGQPIKKHPKRVALAETLFNKTADVVGVLSDEMPTFETMDANVDFKKASKNPSPRFPERILGAVGMVSNYAALGLPDKASHGKRYIDYVYFSRNNVAALSQQSFRSYGSDHGGLAVTAVINATGAGCRAADASAQEPSLPTSLTDPGPGPQDCGVSGPDHCFRPRAANVYRVARATWDCKVDPSPGCLRSYGGWREQGSDPAEDHSQGVAVDMMVTSGGRVDASQAAHGWVEAKWFRAHADQLGIQYIIFNKKIWSQARDSEGWRPYRIIVSEHTASSDHDNHIHITVQQPGVSCESPSSPAKCKGGH